MLPTLSGAQVITTWKDTSSFVDLVSAFFDREGNFYIADQQNNNVWKIDTACLITSIAGTGSGGYNGDSIPATSAELKQPNAVIVDSIGNIYIADALNSRIRKIDRASGLIYTIAGTGVPGYNGDNIPAVNAQLKGPNDICFDKHGNMYISEYANHRIRKINTSGIITTIAGTGIAGCTVNGGRADTTEIGGLTGVCADTIGNIYITDSYEFGVYKVDMSGIITLVAGTTLGYSYNGDNIPATSAQLDPHHPRIDQSGDLFVCDVANNRIRKVDATGIIHTVAGIGSSGNISDGDNGAADSAKIPAPIGVAFDRCGNMYIAQVGNSSKIRKVAFNPSCTDTPCGPSLSVASNFVETEFNVYPNPVKENLSLSFSKGDGTVGVYNIIGQLVYSSVIHEGVNAIDMRRFAAGVYLLELMSDGKRAMRKVVKE